MSYLLNMTLSGSVMLMLYLVMRLGLGGRLSASWRYVMLKTVMFYYLVPLPFLKQFYEVCLTKLFPDQSEILYLWREQNLVVRTEGSLYVNTTFGGKLLLLVIWTTVAGVILLLCGMEYLRNRKRLFQCKSSWVDKTADPRIERLRASYGIRRRVRCYECEMEQSAFTLGIFRPVIFYRSTGNDVADEMIVSHEMNHIRRCDMLWKVLMTCVRLLHWYNPLVWWMWKETDRVCEMVCDEGVVRDRTDEERMQYAELLLRASASGKKKVFGEIALGGAGKRVKERMENVMNAGKGSKRWTKLASAAIVGAAVILNSLTVFAYEDVEYQVIGEKAENPEEQAERLLDSDVVFVPEGVEQAQEVFAELDGCECEFTDEEGNVYPVESGISTAGTCSHTYVSGTLRIHKVNSSGGCTMDYYEAERCSKCGALVMGDLITTATYTVCIH